MAAFTVGSVEDQVRTALLDTYEDAYRYAPKEIYYAMRDGLNHIRNMRPEAKYVDGELVDLNFPTIPTSAETTAIRATTVNMEDRWLEAIVFYCIHRMYTKDDTDTQNQQLAATYYSMFERSLNA